MIAIRTANIENITDGISIQITPQAIEIPINARIIDKYMGWRIFENIPVVMILSMCSDFSCACLWILWQYKCNPKPKAAITPPMIFEYGENGNLIQQNNSPRYQ